MYKKLLCLAINLLSLSVFSQNTSTKPEWLDPYITAVNRLPARAKACVFENCELAMADKKATSKNFLSLNGTWKFKWISKPSLKPATFFEETYDDSRWDNFKVPSN